MNSSLLAGVRYEVMGLEQFSYLAGDLPGFRLRGEQVRVIYEPRDFYKVIGLEHFSYLAGDLPGFRLRGEQVRVIYEPRDFYKVPNNSK